MVCWGFLALLEKFLFIVLFYRQFRLCITALLATRASGKAHTPKATRILRLPPGGFAVVNDSPVDCQSRERTDPQGDAGAVGD